MRRGRDSAANCLVASLSKACALNPTQQSHHVLPSLNPAQQSHPIPRSHSIHYGCSQRDRARQREPNDAPVHSRKRILDEERSSQLHATNARPAGVERYKQITGLKQPATLEEHIGPALEHLKSDAYSDHIKT